MDTQRIRLQVGRSLKPDPSPATDSKSSASGLMAPVRSTCGPAQRSHLHLLCVCVRIGGTGGTMCSAFSMLCTLCVLKCPRCSTGRSTMRRLPATCTSSPTSAAAAANPCTMAAGACIPRGHRRAARVLTVQQHSSGAPRGDPYTPAPQSPPVVRVVLLPNVIDGDGRAGVPAHQMCEAHQVCEDEDKGYFAACTP